MKEVIAAVCRHAGISYSGCRAVNGGDISQAFEVLSGEAKYFLKLNNAATYPGMFKKEKTGLLALTAHSNLSVPGIIAEGVFEQYQFLLLQWLESGTVSRDFWRAFAQGLAGLHRHSAPHFGWKENNYIGSLEQNNNHHSTWAVFYAAERILPLVKTLFDSGAIQKHDVANAEALCKNLGNIFPSENPALLHGDLWSGNFMVTANGTAAVYDPAVYFGHREMDIAMTKLFGGFASEFYFHYHHFFPLEKGWEHRLQLAQLYPLLVHAVLFGSSYTARCTAIIKNWC